MSGKHVHTRAAGVATGVNFLDNVANAPPSYPGIKTDRAYAEGRLAAEQGLSSATNPHGIPSVSKPESWTWAQGHASKASAVAGTEFTTGIPD